MELCCTRFAALVALVFLDRDDVEAAAVLDDADEAAAVDGAAGVDTTRCVGGVRDAFPRRKQSWRSSPPVRGEGSLVVVQAECARV